MTRKQDDDPELETDGNSAGSSEGETSIPVAAEAETETSDDPEQQVSELTDKWLRAKAELDNVRRAARRDVDEVRRFGAGPALLGLLSVLDNLQRALSAPPAGLDEDFAAGLRMIEQQFLDVLGANGVTPVPTEVGDAPDPSAHRALLEQESDEVEAGRILSIVMRGYRLHDRLLREAQVVVARAAAAPDEPVASDDPSGDSSPSSDEL